MKKLLIFLLLIPNITFASPQMIGPDIDDEGRELVTPINEEFYNQDSFTISQYADFHYYKNNFCEISSTEPSPYQGETSTIDYIVKDWNICKSIRKQLNNSMDERFPKRIDLTYKVNTIVNKKKNTFTELKKVVSAKVWSEDVGVKYYIFPQKRTKGDDFYIGTIDSMNKTNLTMKFSETNHRWTNYDIQLSKKSFDTLLKQMMNSSQIELIFDEKLIKMEGEHNYPTSERYTTIYKSSVEFKDN